MNSTLLILNALALAVLVTFHFQPSNDSDTAQFSHTGSHQTQQRPQLAVMTANGQPSVQLTQDAQAAGSSEHLIF
ncbi:hypothetical protein H097_18539 [Pseudomonas sp. FH4]|jgi:hypothetical protein|uniref:Uncharacterized protein n=1 Tax=Pseudomonas brenneri TaxID=129817 RepID=A0A5B2ULL1_9PSED|nr:MULTISPECIES: hypothetical protein [Pseudomonas fluorescens group]ETK16944.1 hypothetical protein H097_18539 [Pseudomonas sp. FH4]KAA2227774.1 hypothetical protein F1720_21345 [Pseudomonas brenneri]MBF8005215.1 hypothetical protein [Pseudomonas brenneri]TWR79980.1 hypothetical protein FJD34_06770 [Pseudomonas brenneri]WJM89995.1 hypothetical protein QDY63_21840 [Pseudomonas brenneri]